MSYSTTDEFTHRSHAAAGFVEGRVCASCNNGWMATMEASIKPLLIRLIDGEQDVKDVDTTDLALLARWTAKTALMLQTSGLGNFHPLPDVFSPLMDGQLPSLMHAVGLSHIAAAPTPFELEAGWLYNPHWTLLAPFTLGEGESFKAAHANTLKVTLWLRSLFLTAALWPDPEWLPVLWDGWHQPLSTEASALPRHEWEVPASDLTAEQLMHLAHGRLALRSPSAVGKLLKH
ncbi:MAG: hypothetical protein ACJ768_21095 [Gaiellaceae bacterium]